MKYIVPVLLWMFVIFVSSSIPQEAFPEVEFWGWAKLIHMFYYCVLCFLIYRGLHRVTSLQALAKHPVVWSIVIATVYGATDEFHQMFTPGRHARVTDVLVDALGACLFFAGAKVLPLLRPGRAPDSR